MTAPSLFDVVDTSPVEPIAVRWSQTLVHPYARYGLAVALTFHAEGKPLTLLTEEELRETLSRAIESGLERFRMETQDDPEHETHLTFRSIPLNRLRENAGLVSGNLAASGKYLYPSIITQDKQVKGTFVDALGIINDLRNEKVMLSRPTALKRSLTPVAGEVNNGGKEKANQRGTLFEAACTAIATVASEKPSALSGGKNTGIFPDLEVEQLMEFVRIFRAFQYEGKSLMIATLNKPGKYRRPVLHDGNYPDAPREASFGAVGLLAAMGYWATEVDTETRAMAIAALDTLRDRPLYLISYDNISQARFGHHVIKMAETGRLFEILRDFYRDAKPYAIYEESFVKHDLPLVRLFYFAFSRFLQQFDTASLRNFLATRAEYPPTTEHLLGGYFVQAEHIPRPIVESARALGQWINRTAYFVAEEDTDKNAQNRAQNVRKAKAKVLVEFESAVMSATSPEDMLHRVSTRAGRLLQGDAPAAATEFYDAAASGVGIDFKQAQHLLIAYIRLRPARVPEVGVEETKSSEPQDNDDDLKEDTQDDN